MTDCKARDAQFAEVTCSFCGGRGLDPFGIMSWNSSCCVCGGKGTVHVRVPYARCAHCQGTGAVKTFTCTACGGKGFVPLPNGPITQCPDCRGSGDDESAPSMACLRCHGRGFVPAEPGAPESASPVSRAERAGETLRR